MGNPEQKADEAFLRSVTLPEEERHLFTTARWAGGFRWFLSPNVVGLERYPRRPPQPWGGTGSVVPFRRRRL